MTCVVAVLGYDGTVCLASDSSAVEDNLILRRAAPKIFKLGEFGIGYCHSFRLGQIIEHFLKPPTLAKEASEKEILGYMVTKFVPALKAVLEQNDYPTQDDEKTDWSIIVCVRGCIFTIESDFHVGYDRTPFAAIGAGTEYALGSMKTSMSSARREIGAKLVAENALWVAEYFSPSVTSPFDFIEL